MRCEDISDALNLLDEDMLRHADMARGNARQKGRWQNRKKYGVMAACFCLLCIAAVGSLFTLPQGSPAPDGDTLPMLTVTEDADSALGFEGYLAYDVAELVNANPWNETVRLSTLPVYQNKLSYGEYFHVTGVDSEAMKAVLRDVAARLHMDTDNLEIQDNSAECREQAASFEEKGIELPADYTDPSTAVFAVENGVKIEVDAALTATISFEPHLSLPDAYNYTFYAPYEDIAAVSGYLRETFQDLIGMENPQVNIYGGDYDIYHQQQYTIAFYDGSGDITDRIVSYHFNRVVFYCDSDGKLWMARIFHPDLTDKTGDYPVISADEALRLLLDGNYITTVPYEMPGADKVARVELVYRTGTHEKYYMPYYRFYVELPDEISGLKNYGAFYVPAVDGAYLSDRPVRDGSIQGAGKRFIVSLLPPQFFTSVSQQSQ